MRESFVLDTGALIALERFDQALWQRLKEARGRGGDIVVPAGVVAEAWRGGPGSAPLTRLLAICEVDPLDEERAREVGVRLEAATPATWWTPTRSVARWSAGRRSRPPTQRTWNPWPRPTSTSPWRSFRPWKDRYAGAAAIGLAFLNRSDNFFM